MRKVPLLLETNRKYVELINSFYELFCLFQFYKDQSMSIEEGEKTKRKKKQHL